MIFKLDSIQQTSIIKEALKPELKKDPPNTSITLVSKENTLTLLIKANNLSVLRAASNSYIRWIQTALKVTNII
jgi:tRNA threonylcarbamoyladenosine modification (KEOPS) complex  Pcc1 subunit